MHQLLASHGPVVQTIRGRFPQTIAVYADPLALWDIAGSLADTVNCAVDLLDLRAASTVMQYQVITMGERLWSVGVQAGLFECFGLSEKMALDTARAPLLADILRTGRIHAG